MMTAAAPSLDELLYKQILRRTDRRVRGLTVELDGDDVVLHGSASSYHVKQLALHGVRELLPFATVRNLIRVGE